MKIDRRLEELEDKIKKLEQPIQFQVGGQKLTLKSWQHEFISQPAGGVRYILKSRQVGFTTLATAYAVQEALKGRRVAIISPSEVLLRELARLVNELVGHLYKVSYSEKLLKVGNQVIVTANSNLESLRGFVADFVYLTEAGLVKDLDKVLAVVLPMGLTRPGFELWIDGTVPKNFNGFVGKFIDQSELIERAKNSASGFAQVGQLNCIFNNLPGLEAAMGSAYSTEIGMSFPDYGSWISVETATELVGRSKLYCFNSCLLRVYHDGVEVVEENFTMSKSFKVRNNVQELEPITPERGRVVKVFGWSARRLYVASKLTDLERALTYLQY